MNVQLNLLHEGTGEVLTVECELGIGPPFSILLLLPNADSLSANESDYFGSLVAVRKELELRGFVVLCNGARRDVYPPTGLTRQWGGARKAYILKPRIRPTPQDTVDIFGPALREHIGTVSEQQAYFKEWFHSITGSTPAM